MSARGATKEDLLLKDLRKQVTALEDDLRTRSESVPAYEEQLKSEYELAREAERMAATYESWRDERITQIAAAWVLACVFVRFCEDNRLIERNWLAGVTDKETGRDGLRDAEDHHDEYVQAHPDKNDRDWLLASFEHLAGTHPAVAGLFDRNHNPLWQMTPSYESATELLRFWRRVGSNGAVLNSFYSSDLNTRFLGDLYQDLSENVRKAYALLQTPVFVEEFVLDLTFESAVREFGMSPIVAIHQADNTVRELHPGLRAIDPACGSGHFLLGLFERLLQKWREMDTALDDWTLIREALTSVHGCDKNPFAAAIARFRLLIAALKAAGARRLDAAPDFPINVAVGDALLHGRGASQWSEDNLFSSREAFYFRTEDVSEYAARCDLLTRDSYHVVIGNPPYITVRDRCESEAYRKAYFACSGSYALSVPFAQRFFELAIRGSGARRGSAGFTGQITSNSFMKREFGKVLVESFFQGGAYRDWQTGLRRDFQGVELTHVVDTSGAYIPGHGTPTVILVGRNRTAYQSDPIRAVLGIKGEPERPADASLGKVWSAIVSQVNQPGSESEWVSVEDAPRGRFASYPWSLEGGGAGGLQNALESGRTLGDKVEDIGFGAVTRADDAYFLGEGALRRAGVPGVLTRFMVSGEGARDWQVEQSLAALWPYVLVDANCHTVRSPKIERLLWPNRVILRERVAYGKTQLQRGLEWFEYSMFFWRRYGGLSLAFACVATHNHVVLDRGERLFNRHAPMIKLPGAATEDDHLALLGVLNSSTACFWLKQVSQGKGGSGLGRGHQDEQWEERYEFTGTKFQDFPIPANLPLSLGRSTEALSRDLIRYSPSSVCVVGDVVSIDSPLRARLDTARDAWTRTREQMIALQEELDWEVYHAYGLLTDDERVRLTAPDPTPENVPPVKLGERAFEIVMARKMAAGELETTWFERHRSTPITEIPSHWPAWYQEIVQARIDTITSRRDIALIERPECKRRWATDPWEKKEKAALRAWLLDRCEDRALWFHIRDQVEQPRPLTVGQLADELSRQDDAKDIATVAGLYAAHLGKPNLSLEQVLLDVTDAEHVPYLAAHRYKDSGLRTRAQWEGVWDLQRKEDKSGERLDIPVPPKYKPADFAKTSYWSNRGKLDVPKERFISYPDAGPDADPTPLLGWAGWDQRDQALALLTIVQDRTRTADWPTERIVPLLAGIHELLPWLWQWFAEVDEEWGDESAAEEIQSFLDGQLAERELTVDQLTSWRPARRTRGRAKVGSKARKPRETVSQPPLTVVGEEDE
ncbi:BREX-2 system adenine-specific DNA-methyltransferase PglX [Streptomyces mayteni]